jgi:hypothetical protein
MGETLLVKEILNPCIVGFRSKGCRILQVRELKQLLMKFLRRGRAG